LLKNNLGALDYIEVTKNTWALAGDISNNLRQQGSMIPITDLIVASLAIEHGYELFTSDNHFDRLVGLKRFLITYQYTPKKPYFYSSKT